MGKKTRKKNKNKHKRRTKTIDTIKSMLRERNRVKVDNEADFKNRGTQLCQLFARYNAEDVVLALNVSDLWLPNISSQVKHHFAFGVLVSMDADQFTPLNRLDTYELFSSFISDAYDLFPSFFMLEDYVPESDWGEIRAALNDESLNIFYGGSVERISDFIEAFKLRYETQLAALNDMFIALKLQDHLISNVDRDVVGNVQEISPGHIEVPPEPFWLQCREALLTSGDVLATIISDISSTLVLELGSFKYPSTWSSFGDAVMSGISLPAVMLRINGKQLPLSLRNAASVVIDYWASNAEINPATLEADLNRSVTDFLSLRLKHGSVIGGPLKLATRMNRLPYRFATVIQSEKKFYFVAILNSESLPSLSAMERDVYKLLASGEEWSLWNEVNHNGVLFRNKDGSQPKSDEISILAVLSHVSTTSPSLAMPEITNAHIIGLPDFVTVFDSLEDANEFDKFWVYVDSNKSMMMGSMFSGPADLFGSFRDSYGLLVDGAITPNVIYLDPHWGSNWRYKDLKKFWMDAPLQFPDDTLAWKVESKSDGLQCLISKGTPTIAWCTTVGDCTVHFVLHVLEQGLDQLNGRMLGLFIHCIADAISQRRDLLEDLPLFSRKRIVVTCRANSNTLVTEMGDENTERNVSEPLLSGWQLNNEANASFLSATVNINLARLQFSLDSATDASFEVDCVSDGVTGLSALIGQSLSSEQASRLLDTASRKPRFTLKMVSRNVDVPDHPTVEIPKPEQYKIARRDLAIILKNQGGEEGRYELTQAKAIIDPARDVFRAQIHTQISKFDQRALLLLCIEQHDALSVEHKQNIFRIKMSLEHEVSYDRSAAITESYEKFIHNARNYRYLLECCLSLQKTELDPISTSDVVQLIAHIDWLFVLYGASDTLHNDIDVAGLELDHLFIPHVFYSADREIREKEFSLEMANAKLGLEVTPEDEVSSTQESGDDWEDLDRSFLKYLGFTFTQLTQMFSILARWQTVSDEPELRFSYQASTSVIVEILKNTIEGLTNDVAILLIDFATLNPSQIRRLLGKSIDESDVPIWEHTKRGSRYTIRPLIPVDINNLAWGADAADRAASIWINSISNGYLPADFDWPQVKDAVRKIKASIEQQLEVRAFEVCSRATSFLQHGINFMHRFPKESFDDVGDFDVLAYWPETNQWLSIECKYNQPPFCLKDMRRLRDRIFGSHSERGQITKIERWHKFLSSHAEHLRVLLGWPEPKLGTTPQITDVYISRDIYWWMRNPPYEVTTHFVRIDALDSWLRNQSFLNEVFSQ